MNNFSHEDIVAHQWPLTIEWVYSSTDPLSEMFPELTRDLHIHFATIQCIVGAFSSPKISFVLYKTKEVASYVIASLPERESWKNRILSLAVLKEPKAIQEAINRLLEDDTIFHPDDAENARLWLSSQLHRSNGETIELTFSEILGQSGSTLLYFYPKDNTPGCTKEAQDFTRLRNEFSTLWIQIVGVSRDTIASHEKFTISCALWIDLISDSDEMLHHHFWVIGEKKNYGKVSIWVIRSTFLLDNGEM
jgi:peroxiredoxin Q/BCP